MNDNIEKIEKLISDLNTSINASMYRDREMLKELSELKGKIQALKAMADTEYDNIPVTVLSKLFGWEEA